MNRARVEEIEEAITNLHVELVTDPRTQGPGYIARKIKEALDAVEEANKYNAEVGRALMTQKERVSLLDLEIEEGARAHLLSRAIQDLDGISMEEKKARAIMNMERAHRDELLRGYRDRNESPPVKIPTLRQDLCEAKTMEEILRDLQLRIKEKISFLKRVDSGVRLQQKAMENELQLYGPFPVRRSIEGRRTQQAPVLMIPRNGSINGESLRTDQSWQNLLPGQATTDGETHEE